MTVNSSFRLVITIILLLGSSTSFCATYMSRNEFATEALANNASAAQVKTKTLWLKSALQAKISQLLQHQYPKLRLRYYQVKEINNSEDNQTIWFLEEIGKDKPISFGVSVKNNQINLIKVLAFKESRGGEIRMQAFTEQFHDSKLTDKLLLDKTIDGISGATLSVTAAVKISRLALLLHREVNER